MAGFVAGFLAAGFVAAGFLAAGFLAAGLAAVRAAAAGLRGNETAVRGAALVAPAALFARRFFFAPASAFAPPAFFTLGAALRPAAVFLTARNVLPAGRALREGLVGFTMMMSQCSVFLERQSMLGMTLQALR
jgi:hypothetical protein